jgi:hypothetical protein
MPHLAALEDAGWSFDALKTGDRLSVATAASKQALAVVSHDLGRPIPGLAARVSPGWLRLLLALSPKLVPLPLEPYLAWHFTKVGDQTRMLLGRYIARGQGAGLPTDALESLLAQLPG